MLVTTQRQEMSMYIFNNENSITFKRCHQRLSQQNKVRLRREYNLIVAYRSPSARQFEGHVLQNEMICKGSCYT